MSLKVGSEIMTREILIAAVAAHQEMIQPERQREVAAGKITDSIESFCWLTKFFNIIYSRITGYVLILQEYDYDNPFLDPIVSNLCSIRNPCSRMNIQPFPLEWLSPPLFYGFFSYMGSLTRYPYEEEVLWLVKLDTLPISRAQVNKSQLNLFENSCIN